MCGISLPSLALLKRDRRPVNLQWEQCRVVGPSPPPLCSLRAGPSWKIMSWGFQPGVGWSSRWFTVRDEHALTLCFSTRWCWRERCCWGKMDSRRLVTSVGKGESWRRKLGQGIPEQRPCWRALPAAFCLHSNDVLRWVHGGSRLPLASSNCSNFSKKKSFSSCVTGRSRRVKNSSRMISWKYLCLLLIPAMFLRGPLLVSKVEGCPTPRQYFLPFLALTSAQLIPHSSSCDWEIQPKIWMSPWIWTPIGVFILKSKLLFSKQIRGLFQC